MAVNQLFKEKLVSYQQTVEAALDIYLPKINTRPKNLHAAMRYSMEAGGKRIRPVLLLSGSDLLGTLHDPRPAAVAIECLHTYTLIHDDLPSIDDSPLRRGRTACHKQFDEATAILAGDALLTYAFELLSTHYSTDSALAVELIKDLANASGSQRLIGGQMEDIENEGKVVNKDTLSYIHENKTGALLTCALTMGLRFGNPTGEQLAMAQKVGYHLGLGFQIMDDILDATSDSETLGKPVGNDDQVEKLTYVALYGVEGARQKAKEHSNAGMIAAQSFGENGNFLIQLIEQLANRIN